MLHKLLTFSIVIILPLSASNIANAEERFPLGYKKNSVTLTTESTSIIFTDSLAKEIKIYPSDLLGVKTYGSELAFWSADPLDKNYVTGEFTSPDGYGISIKRNPRYVESATFWTITITPKSYRGMKNGTYDLDVFELNSGTASTPLRISITVNVDAKLNNLYEPNFEFYCDSTFYGEQTGVGADLVEGKYEVTYSYRQIGQKNWTKGKGFSWDVKKGVVFYPFKITKPTQMQVNVGFEGKQFPFVIDLTKPKAKIQLSAPGAAIVGDSFTLYARTIKNYSGSCVVNNYSMQFKIKKGFGSINLYGVTPGNLNLYVSCSSSNWADSGSSAFVFIRQ
jgi:hypothetical protein